MTRVTAWLRSQAKEAGLGALHSVHIISAKRPNTVEFKRLVAKIRSAAQPDPIQAGRYKRRYKDKSTTTTTTGKTASALDVYIIGATNVGKSTLVNALIDANVISKGRKVTTSGLPGTTLDLVEFTLNKEKSSSSSRFSSSPQHQSGRLFDTPGVVDRSHLMHNLESKELKAVTPRSSLKPVTYKLKKGQVLMLGAMCMIEQLDGKPFFYTAVMSNQVSCHVSRRERVAELLSTKTGGAAPMLYPPFEKRRVCDVGLGAVDEWAAEMLDYRKCPSRNNVEEEEENYCRNDEISSSNTSSGNNSTNNNNKQHGSSSSVRILSFTGKGWREACVDIVFPGLGWVGLTGVGSVRVAVHCPDHKIGQPITRNEPFLPYDALPTSKKFTGNPSRR